MKHQTAFTKHPPKLKRKSTCKFTNPTFKTSIKTFQSSIKKNPLMKPLGVKFVSKDMAIGDAYTSMDYKKNPNRKKSRSYNNPTSKRVLRAVKKKERRKTIVCQED